MERSTTISAESTAKWLEARGIPLRDDDIVCSWMETPRRPEITNLVVTQRKCEYWGYPKNMGHGRVSGLANFVNCWEAYGQTAMVISSQASKEEGSTIRAQARTAKRLEARSIFIEDDDMIWTSDESRRRLGIAIRVVTKSDHYS
jgi:hypothetical protein